MASRKTNELWLAQLTNLPTASGLEHAVIDWVRAWAGRRTDLVVTPDSGGNLLITQKGRKSRPPVVAVAHMDHPAFVALTSAGGSVDFEFRGGVDAAYFERAAVLFNSDGRWQRGVVTEYDPSTQRGQVELSSDVELRPGAIGRWVFPEEKDPVGRFSGPACDDLAGVAAALAALDRARGDASRRHLAVLLTRAEEVGLVGAIHAAKSGALPEEARIISIETSRELANARIGDGPIVRVGDAVTMFDNQLTDRIAAGAREAGLRHQRRLMDGGGCEASAFGLFGYRATGLCLALGNWHNRGNLDEFERGVGDAVPKMEEISLSDFHGLVDLLGNAVPAVDMPDPTIARFEEHYEEARRILDSGTVI